MSEPRDPKQDGAGKGGRFERIQDDARLRLAFERSEPSNLYVETEVLRRGHTIEAVVYTAPGVPEWAVAS